MERFDRKFSDLPWRKPSPELREKIFGPPQQRPILARLMDRRIASGWAASVALAAGILGFVLGVLLPGEGVQQIELADNLPETPLVEIQPDMRVVEVRSVANSFDFSPEGGELLNGEYDVFFGDVEENGG